MSTAAAKTTGRPSGGYKNAAGKRVPGTTTITGRFKESGGLIFWAWDLGMQGIDLKDAREGAADAGTCAHEQIDAHLHGRTFDPGPWPADVRAKADHAFLGYLEWQQQTGLKMVASEVSLVSEKYQFGGTFDAVVSSGSLVLLDYKTSGGIYSDMLIQIGGGYSVLWEEHHPEEKLAGMDILRVSKPEALDDPVSFHHHHWSAEIFPICQEQFLYFRQAYDLDKRIKGLL